MAANGTFIKVYRKMTEWEWYGDTACFRVFMHLLLKANWEDSSFRGVEIPRGSVVVGRKSLAQELGLSEGKIRVASKRLSDSHQITIKTTNQFSVISICNFDTYNPTKEEENQQIANGSPADSQQIATSKEVKKKRSKEEATRKPPSADGERVNFYLTKKKKKLQGRRLETFEEFWEAFGYKDGRKEAADAWLEIPELTTTLVSKIVSAARIEAQGRAAIVRKGSTPKMAQGWISGARWENEGMKLNVAPAKRPTIAQPTRWKEAMRHKLQDAPVKLAAWIESEPDERWESLRETEKLELTEIINTQLEF